MASRHKPVVPDELLDRLLGGSDALEAFQSGDLVQDLKKALAERILNAELDQHLDDEDEQSSGNHRNGHSRKRVLTDDGRMELSIPRDRQGRFDPKLVEKHCRRLPGFDDKVISMYARGMSAREIQGHVRELYGIKVSPELISKVTTIAQHGQQFGPQFRRQIAVCKQFINESDGQKTQSGISLDESGSIDLTFLVQTHQRRYCTNA